MIIEKHGIATQVYDSARKRFINPYAEDDKHTLKNLLLWKLGTFNDKQEIISAPLNFTPFIPNIPVDPQKPKARWINHSTFFLSIEGVHILTDPIWSYRCSPSQHIGPIRQHNPAVALQDLGHVDHVFISHNHYDHLDKQTVLDLHTLFPTIRWWVPMGVKSWFHKMGIHHVEEFGWGEGFSFRSEHNPSQLIRCTAVPAQHFSGRSLLDKCTTLWLGWIIEFSSPSLKKTLYFIGDTGYNPVDFKAVGQQWPIIDLALIPIGSYLPKKFRSSVHVDPESAVQIHKEIRAKKSVGIHWGTFNLSDEKGLRPAYDLALSLEKEGIHPQDFLSIPPGHEINW